MSDDTGADRMSGKHAAALDQVVQSMKEDAEAVTWWIRDVSASAAFLRAALTPAPEGGEFVLVPREPTLAMIEAGAALPLVGQFYPGMTADESEHKNESHHARERRAAIYRAMISARGTHAVDPVADTGNEEADRLIDRLMSSDPGFDDCTDAAAMIRSLAAAPPVGRGTGFVRCLTCNDTGEFDTGFKVFGEARMAKCTEGCAPVGRDAVLVGYMDPAAEFMLPKSGECVLSSHVVLVRDPGGIYTKPIYATPAAVVPSHPDDAAVDAFAAAMKGKLAIARAKGRGGWNDKDDCTQAHLSALLRGHVEKGDPLDVANFCLFLHQRGEGITPAAVVSDAREAFNVGDRVLWTDNYGKQHPATIVKFNPASYDAEIDGGFDAEGYPSERYAALTDKGAA